MKKLNKEYTDILEKIIFDLTYTYIQNKILIDIYEGDDKYCKDAKKENEEIEYKLEILVDIYDIVKDTIED